MKLNGSTIELRVKLMDSRIVEVGGTQGVAVKCVDILGNTDAKAAYWAIPDAEARKPGEQTGLDTPVVLALNYGR